MSQVSVERPAPSDKKIRTSDDFELCYLRHQYFRRVKYNPTECEMTPYMGIVTNLTKNTFFTYFNLFKSVGLGQEDLLNVGLVHLVSFLGLYALEKSKIKKKEYILKFKFKYKKYPNQEDFDQKNKANFTLFFKQRMEDVVRVCRQKSRNIKGQPSEEFVVFCGKDVPPKYPRKLLKNSDEFGYKKVDFSIFRSIRKKANVNHDATIFQFKDTWYVAVPLDQKRLEIDDIVGSGYNPYENAHNMQPDDLFAEKEFERLNTAFDKNPDYKKQTILAEFVAKNKNKAQYREEVATARKLLRSLGD